MLESPFSKVAGMKEYFIKIDSKTGALLFLKNTPDGCFCNHFTVVCKSI